MRQGRHVVRFSSRLVRAGVVVFTLGAATALGCSVIVDFDENKIPGEDAGADSGAAETSTTDTGVDSGTDTATTDTATDSATTDSTTDSGGTDSGADDADAGATDGGTDGADAADSGAADSGAADSGAADSGADATDGAATDAAGDATDASDSADAGASTTFTATIDGGQEIPANTSTATGKAVCVLNGAETTLDCTVTHTVTGTTAMHLHQAFGGLNGGVALTFSSLTSPVSQSFSVTTGQVTSLKAGQLYVNIHSTTIGSGEIRGQLLKPGQKLFTAAPLSGANEVPAVSTTITGGSSCIVDGSAVSCMVQASGFSADTPSAAHIHEGDKTMNGGAKVSFSLGAPASDTITGTATATVGTELDATKLGASTSFDTSQYYVNVHTPAFGSGAVRSQLVLRMTAPSP